MKKLVSVSIAIFIRDVNESGFQAWMQVRTEAGPIFGKWEFPGGKIEAGEEAIAAMKREVHEEVDFLIDHLKHIKLFRLYPYFNGEKTICLFPFLVEGAVPPPGKGEWFTINYETKSQPLADKIPSANIPLINDLCDYLKSLTGTGTYDLLWK